MLRGRVSAIVLAVLGALLGAGAASFAGPCVHDDGSAAACQLAGTLIVAMGVAIAVLSLARIVVATPRPSAVLAALTAAAGVAAAALPGTAAPLCMMATMRCHTVMRPFALVIGVLVAIVATIDAVRLARAPRGATARPPRA